MALLHQGVDGAMIAMILGHESMDTTEIYLHASLELIVSVGTIHSVPWMRSSNPAGSIDGACTDTPSRGDKQRALNKTMPTYGPLGRFRPDDALLAFLKSL
jgi:integrase/recombinase XerD